MKKMLVLLAFLTLNSFAGTVEVVEIPETSTIFRASDLDFSYGKNVGLGRAWVEVTAIQTPDDMNTFFYRANVAGLSLVGNEIVLNAEGQNVVCATVGRRVRATGNCQFSVKKEKRMIDDGYNGYSETVYVVSLIY
jgi:hypothetical protein